MNHDTTANSPKESGTNATETSIPSHESRLGNNSLRPYRSGDFSRTMKRKASRISHHKAKREIRNAPWTPGDDYLLINSVVMVSSIFCWLRQLTG
uniref:Transposase n=1 Tax=Schistosoma mansoni TaxID=6183 RepID=A0A5K4FDX4_SCHMA